MHWQHIEDVFFDRMNEIRQAIEVPIIRSPRHHQGFGRQDFPQYFFDLKDGKLGELLAGKPAVGNRFCLGIVFGFKGEGVHGVSLEENRTHDGNA